MGASKIIQYKPYFSTLNGVGYGLGEVLLQLFHWRPEYECAVKHLITKQIPLNNLSKIIIKPPE